MKKINIEFRTLKILYDKYRDYLLPLGIIFISFFLFINIVTPQINSLLDLQREARKEQEKLSILRDNLNLLSSLDESTLDSYLGLTSDTLPATKDFAGIISAISVSADKAGVFLGDFEFQVGDISKASPTVAGSPSLQLELNVTGGVNGVIKFVEELYRSVPISEVSSIEFGNNRSSITVVFYYKPLPPIKFRDDVRLELTTQKDQSLISLIQSWNNPKVFQAITKSSSPSASFTSPF